MLSTQNHILDYIKYHNSVANKRNLPNYNPKLLIPNIENESCDGRTDTWATNCAFNIIPRDSPVAGYYIFNHLWNINEPTYVTHMWQVMKRNLHQVMKRNLHQVMKRNLRNSYTMGCPPVRGDNPRALASGLSYVQVDKHGIITLYHLHQCRPSTA